jgi:hypothetical protein
MGSKLKLADLHHHLRDSTASRPLGANGTNGVM